MDTFDKGEATFTLADFFLLIARIIGSFLKLRFEWFNIKFI